MQSLIEAYKPEFDALFDPELYDENNERIAPVSAEEYTALGCAADVLGCFEAHEQALQTLEDLGDKPTEPENFIVAQNVVTADSDSDEMSVAMATLIVEEHYLAVDTWRRGVFNAKKQIELSFEGAKKNIADYVEISSLEPKSATKV